MSLMVEGIVDGGMDVEKPLRRSRRLEPLHLVFSSSHDSERIYTFWKYFRNSFARDAGLRIDHLLLSPSLAGRLVAAGVDREVRAQEHSSDHAPVWIELADAKAGSRQRARRPNSDSRS
jgi:endonuclease/exonuclease/phosphatase family metal-dependent hydrolase